MNKDDLFLTKIRENLLKVPNDELLLLKSHLIAEEMMDRCIIHHLGKNIAKNLNLSFSKKIILIQGLLGLNDDNQTLKNIRTINKIRNNFAHNLDYDIKNDLLNLINEISDQVVSNENEEKKYIGYLGISISYLLGNLWGTLNTYIPK